MLRGSFPREVLNLSRCKNSSLIPISNWHIASKGIEWAIYLFRFVILYVKGLLFFFTSCKYIIFVIKLYLYDICNRNWRTTTKYFNVQTFCICTLYSYFNLRNIRRYWKLQFLIKRSCLWFYKYSVKNNKIQQSWLFPGLCVGQWLVRCYDSLRKNQLPETRNIIPSFANQVKIQFSDLMKFLYFLNLHHNTWCTHSSILLLYCNNIVLLFVRLVCIVLNMYMANHILELNWNLPGNIFL